MILAKFEQTKTMCVQTGGGSDVVVNSDHNMLERNLSEEVNPSGSEADV